MVTGSVEDSNLTIGSGSSYKMGPDITTPISSYNRDSNARNNDSSVKSSSLLEDKDPKDRLSK